MHVYLAVCCAAREKGERVQASWSAGIVGAFGGCCSIAFIRCQSKTETTQVEAVFRSHSTTSDGERWCWWWKMRFRNKLLMLMVVSHNVVWNVTQNKVLLNVWLKGPVSLKKWDLKFAKFSSMSLCWWVCLSAGLHKNYWTCFQWDGLGFLTFCAGPAKGTNQRIFVFLIFFNISIFFC